MDFNFSKDMIRELLIDCMHSDENAEKFFNGLTDNFELLKFLVEIVSEDYSEDAQICAAYWISKFDTHLLTQIETELLLFQEYEYNCISGPIMVALGKINSKDGLRYLLDEKMGKKMSWEVKALKEYMKHI